MGCTPFSPTHQVIPAKAGIAVLFAASPTEIPAFAGMTSCNAPLRARAPDERL
jgi:hypothetical protein